MQTRTEALAVGARLKSALSAKVRRKNTLEQVCGPGGVRVPDNSLPPVPDPCVWEDAGTLRTIPLEPWAWISACKAPRKKQVVSCRSEPSGRSFSKAKYFHEILLFR